MHLAYDTLPSDLRAAVEGRRAEHSYLAKYEELIDYLREKNPGDTIKLGGLVVRAQRVVGLDRRDEVAEH